MAGGTASGPQRARGRGATALAGGSSPSRPSWRQRRRQGRTVSECGCVSAARWVGGPAAPSPARAAPCGAPWELGHTWRKVRQIPRWCHVCSRRLARWARSSGAEGVGVPPASGPPRRLAGGPEGQGPPASVGGLPWQKRGPLVAAPEEGRQGHPASVPAPHAELAVVRRGSAADQRCIWSRHEELVKALQRAKGTSSRRLPRRSEVRGWIVSGRSPGGKAQQLTLTPEGIKGGYSYKTLALRDNGQTNK